MRIEHCCNGEEGITARAVFDDDRLAPFRRKLVGQQTSGDIDTRAWTKRNNKADGALRPLIRCLRLREWRGDNRGGDAKVKGQQKAARHEYSWH
jgi:hypothetical protein